MSRRPPLQFAPDLPPLALAPLEAPGAGPAWLIDVDKGCILAANASGAALLGLVAGGPPAMLDAAMPALGRLRALCSADAPPGEGPEPLVFWTRAGAVQCLCHVRMLEGSRPRLAAVAAHDGARTSPATGGDIGVHTLSPGDDAAKLKEIARRIREGQMAGGRPEMRNSENVAPLQDRAAVLPRPAVEEERKTSDALLHASLAHELRTPLGAIAAAAEVMKDQRFGPIGSARYLGYVKDIHGTAQHALAVIERMLTAAHDPPDADAEPLSFAEIDAGALLKSTVSQLGPLAERAGITLALELAPRLPHLIADATSLRQIVLNLVTNALKFTEPGGRVAIAARYDGDGPFSVAVSDTGAGMSRREVARVLGRSGRTRPEPAEKRAGLGLGLPLVQKLAAANGAELIIESTPGRGTSASVIFRKDRVIPV
jgi:two-component system cell cycle sensor histidine kinase PleC